MRARRERQPPDERELEVLRDQLERSIGDGHKIVDEQFSRGRWNAWVVQTRELIERALNGDWAQEFDDATDQPYEDDDPYAGYGLSAEQKAKGDLDARNGDIVAKIEFAQRAAQAIDGAIERMRARPAQPLLHNEDFAFMRSADLREIATRDYAELRSLDAHAIKTRALLAGSVVEAVLMDQLEAKGIERAKTDKMDLVDLVREASSIGIVKKRAANAAGAVRGLRNFVHPAVELREGRLRDEDARAAVILLELVLADIRH